MNSTLRDKYVNSLFLLFFRVETIDQVNREIEKYKSDISEIQHNINNQMLTPYEKEVAMQDIDNLNNKKSTFEKANNELTREINEANKNITSMYYQKLFGNLRDLFDDPEMVRQIDEFKD